MKVIGSCSSSLGPCAKFELLRTQLWMRCTLYCERPWRLDTVTRRGKYLCSENSIWSWEHFYEKKNLKPANSRIPTSYLWRRTAIFSPGWVMVGHHFTTICCSGASALRETGCDLGERPAWLGLTAWQGLFAASRPLVLEKHYVMNQWSLAYAASTVDLAARLAIIMHFCC